MREDGNDIILDKPYEKKLSLLPERFPLSDARGAMAELIVAARQEGMRIDDENLRRYGRPLSSPDHDSDQESALTLRGNRIAFMMSDLAGIAVRNKISLSE